MVVVVILKPYSARISRSVYGCSSVSLDISVISYYEVLRRYLCLLLPVKCIYAHIN